MPTCVAACSSTASCGWCASTAVQRLVAFSCKKRGFCPSCGARRMAESARHPVEEVFGPRPVRQWC
nr:transposase zinc-binding domain-containing protein [Escherichia coli]